MGSPFSGVSRVRSPRNGILGGVFQGYIDSPSSRLWCQAGFRLVGKTCQITKKCGLFTKFLAEIVKKSVYFCQSSARSGGPSAKFRRSARLPGQRQQAGAQHSRHVYSCLYVSSNSAKFGPSFAKLQPNFERLRQIWPLENTNRNPGVRQVVLCLDVVKP